MFLMNPINICFLSSKKSENIFNNSQETHRDKMNKTIKKSWLTKKRVRIGFKRVQKEYKVV